MRYQIFIGESKGTMRYAGTATDLRRAEELGRELQRDADPVPVIFEVREHPDDLPR